ncbi:MAG: hydrogen gas-evolving membrane-bound hydrogenase subunit E, partial [Byssovorax sp.]
GITGYVIWRHVAIPPGEPETQLLSDRLAAAVLYLSGRVGRRVQAGGHPRYLTVMLLFAAAAAAAAVFLADGAFARALSPPGPDAGIAWFPALLITAGAALTPVVRGRVTRLVTLAIAGYGTALFYLAFRAVDLVLTQILVETVTLVLLLLAFRRLPERAEDLRPPRLRLWHAVVAGITGTGAALLAFRAGVLLPEGRAGAQQLELAWPEAGGRNAVNVILVDFRGADTLGEITVLAIAALGVVALLRRGSSAGSEKR